MQPIGPRLILGYLAYNLPYMIRDTAFWGREHQAIPRSLSEKWHLEPFSADAAPLWKGLSNLVAENKCYCSRPHRLALAKQNLGFSQFPDNLLRGKSFLLHRCFPLFVHLRTNLTYGPIFRGQVTQVARERSASRYVAVQIRMPPRKKQGVS